MYKGGRIQREQQGQHELSDGSASGSVSDYEGDANSDDAADSPHRRRAAAMSEPPSVKPLADDAELQNVRQKRKYGDLSLYRYLLGSVNVALFVFWVCCTAFAAVIQAMPRRLLQRYRRLRLSNG